MRTSLLASVCAGITLLSSSALADGGSALSFGLRTGGALPLGNLDRFQKLSDRWSAQVPLWVDAGFKFHPSVYLGAFFQYGIAFVSSEVDTCNASGTSCSSSDLRFGLNAHYHWTPGSRFDFWTGLGGGYEIASFKRSGAEGDSTDTYRGFEFGNLQAGGDYKLPSGFGIGPWITLTIAQYRERTVDPKPYGVMTALLSGDRALHLWLFFGVRGVFDIRL